PYLHSQIEEYGLQGVLERDMDIIPIVMEMEEMGILLDVPVLESLQTDLNELVDGAQIDINYLAGHYVNPNSSQQVVALLQDEGIYTDLETSTDASVLDQYREHIIVNKIQDYRGYAKLKSTYVEPWLGQERAYTHFRMDLSTARLASFDRNLQNIPKPMREIFAPDYGIWTSADWSQIELRVWAYVTGDPTMLRAYREGKDIHTITQMALWPNSKPSDPIARRYAKNFNFAMIYLATPDTLARSTGLPVRVCQAYREHWLALYPVGYQWMLRQSVEGPEQGYVETLMGRVLALPLLAESTPAHRSKCAINYPIQGTAAEIVKRGMLIVGGMEIEQAVQVHDELLCDGDYDMPVEKLAHIHGGIYTPVEVTKGPDWARLITV
ncbi:hypothetical protein LCGC14_2026140, partial [marine sediment metagenome]